MFNPEMMKMAQDMMSKMSPEQLAAMQRQAANMNPEMMQQAMNMAQNMSPEDMRQAQQAASNLPPDYVASQASNFESNMSSRQKFQYDASIQLKNEGNQLHGQRRYREASEKYQRALSNLSGHSSQQAKELSTSCHSNLASCFLQLGEYKQCVTQCNEVLSTDTNNRKALYRRGQALCKLGDGFSAIKDLQRALALSPESEKGTIREKLLEAEQLERHASRGVTIEEVTESEPGPSAVNDRAEVDGQVEDAPDAVQSNSGAPGSFPAATAGGMPSGIDRQQVQQMAQMMKSNPAMMQTMVEQMRGMSDEQIQQAVQQAGGSSAGITPEMARMAANSMRHMSPEQIQSMVDQAGRASGSSSSSPQFSVTPEMAAAAGSTDPHAQIQAASAAIKQNPEMLKSMAKMMESMPPEQLQAMAANIPGAPPGMKFDAEQMKMVAKMMENMSPEDMEKMAQMANTMGGTAGAAGVGAGGISADEAGAAQGVPSAGFTPGSMPPGMMDEVRRKMEDPALMKMMQNMLKSMDPEQMAAMMQQSGLKVTPEQAKKMTESLGNISENHIEMIARLTRYANRVIDAFQRAKAMVLSQGLLVLALLVLLLAVALRWLGWI